MLDHPWSEPPALGQACEVAEGVLWTRLPLPFPGLDHVNIYALDDGEAWTLLDTGLDWAKSRAALAAFQKALGRPVARVVITHHHPDHIGMAGTLARQGVEVLISRVAYLSARMLSFDVQERPTPEMVRFRNRAGMTGAALAAYAEERPFNLADGVAALPLGFTRLSEGDTLHAGGRDWRVRLGEGHAPEMVTLWSEDGALMLAGDQVLPGISPNIGVSATEPGADPLSGWIETCTRFRALGGDPLVLPGHRLPFCGLHTR
ncbi:MAG: MBL fold metallo-hydrolase, partial [Pseudomonadota bacterium]